MLALGMEQQQQQPCWGYPCLAGGQAAVKRIITLPGEAGESLLLKLCTPDAHTVGMCRTRHSIPLALTFILWFLVLQCFHSFTLKMYRRDEKTKLICLHFEIRVFSGIAPDCQHSMGYMHTIEPIFREWIFTCMQTNMTYSFFWLFCIYKERY